MTASSDLVIVLEQTLNPQTSKLGLDPLSVELIAAESRLKNEASSQTDFLVSLLNLIATAGVALPIRQAGALFFKNFVRQNWKVEKPRYTLWGGLC